MQAATARLAALLFLLIVAAPEAAEAQAGRSIRVQGESPAKANIKTAADPRASGRGFLALDTARRPPRRGWYASYRVEVSAAGVYRLDAVVTSPWDNGQPGVGSQFGVSVNHGSYAPASKSDPQWADFPRTWGDLFRARLDDVELRRGVNTIAFKVDPRARPPYRLALDEFTLAPTQLAPRDTYIGNPARNLGIYRGRERATLRFRLNGHAPEAQTVRYRVTDYFSDEIASGTATIPAGARTAGVALPALAPGHYRSEASLAASPGDTVVGYFAHLPAREAVRGPTNRFAVGTSVPSLVPWSILEPFAAAMKEMGAGYVREYSSINRITRAFHAHGLKTIEVLGPAGRVTPASAPLPADLRDAYRAARRLARKARGVRADTLQVSNEPDVDTTSSTGDQHAAYVKAAALGVADSPRRPLIALPGIASEGYFQNLMLRNDVVRYADVWAFHGYPYPYEPGALNPFPGAGDQQELRRRYDTRTQLWMTESGIFVPRSPGGDLSASRQADQARYLVQSTVADLADGTDKHFWFGGAPCCDDGGIYYGLLSREFQPLASYSAHAAMSSILGEANFATALEGLPRGVFGYVFRNGGQAITVLWAEASTRVNAPVPGSRVEVHDIMGKHRATVVPAGGTVGVTASLDPIYLVSDDAGDLSARPPANDGRRARRNHSRAERIVLSQRFAFENAAPNKDNGDAEPPLGYRLGATTAWRSTSTTSTTTRNGSRSKGTRTAAGP